MRIYWTLKSIPELSQLSLRERVARWRRAYALTRGRWHNWVGAGVGGLFAGAGAHFHGLAGAIVGGCVGGLIYSQIIIAFVRKHHRSILLGQVTERKQG